MGATQSGVFALARESEIELEPGQALPWLTNRGHANPVLQDAVPASTLRLLSAIHERLGGDEHALAAKRAGSSPRPDFFLRSAALIVEVDEIQHFTNDRLATLELYPQSAQVAFDVDEYRTLIQRWSSIADNYRAVGLFSVCAAFPAILARCLTYRKLWEKRRGLRRSRVM